MGFDTFDLLLSGWIFFIYSATCIISIIFTFSLELYRNIEEKLGSYIFSSRILSPLDKDIDWLNIWLMKHHKIVGPILISLSLVNLKLFFDIINNFKSLRP